MPDVLMRTLLLELERPRKPGQTNLSHTFHTLAERIQRRALIVILSDLFDDQERVIQGLRHFRHNKHEVIVFHVLDPWELTFPFDQTRRFVDLETQREMDVPGYLVRDAYLEQLSHFLGNYRRDCSDGYIDYNVVDTSRPFDEFLSSYLVKRSRLG